MRYAVFEPGVFTSPAVDGMFENPAIGGFDPTNDYVYAYQIENTGTAAISSLQLALGTRGIFSDLGGDTMADPAGVSPIPLPAALWMGAATMSGLGGARFLRRGGGIAVGLMEGHAGSCVMACRCKDGKDMKDNRNTRDIKDRGDREVQ